AGGQSAPVEGTPGADTVRQGGGYTHDDGAAHAVAHGADFAVAVHGRLLVQPGDEGARVSHVGGRIELTGHGTDDGGNRRILEAGAFSNDRGAGAAVKGVHYQ